MTNVNQQLNAFRRFFLLNKLTDEQLIVLASRADYRAFSKGRVILELNSRDSCNYFLLQGEILLVASDGRQTRVAANSERAQQAVAYLQPRQFEVKALTTCEFIVVDQPTLTQMLKEAPTSYQLTESDAAWSVSESPAYAIVSAFHQDLQARRLRLPSLPDLALRIKEICEQPTSQLSDMAKVIMRDPPITAKLIHAANSPLYRGFNDIESCQDAVIRLGMETTRQLITVFTLRELFTSQSAILKRRMQTLWEHSLEVGAIAFVLAKMTPKLSAELAMLAGILHDIGVVPVIQYAEGFQDVLHDDATLARIISELRAEIGCTLLSHWAFPASITDAVRQAENYYYDSGSDQPGYADLVIVAQAHAFIGKPESTEIPVMDEIPAFTKLARGKMSPQTSFQVLQQSKEEIQNLKQVMG